MIPQASPPTPGETEYGQQLFNSLCEDHELAAGHARDEQLLAAFDHLVEAAGADRPTWQIHLFDAPGIVDVRAVHGNYIFVWSGLLDIVQNEDEIAAVLAGEMAHAMSFSASRRWRPVSPLCRSAMGWWPSAGMAG